MKKYLLLLAVIVSISLWADNTYNLVTTSSVSFIPEGVINGKAIFSVSPTKKVFFSKGNLQFCANPTTAPTTHAVQGGGTAQGIWRFALNQYDFVGCNDYPGNVSGSSNNDISATYAGWIDLFGWGTSEFNDPSDTRATHYYMPYDHTISNDNDHGAYGPDYEKNQNLIGSNYDWGYYNAIENGGGDPGYWRVLEREEWAYLLGFTNSLHPNKREGAENKWTMATVHGYRGMIILPDALTASILQSTYGITLSMGSYSSYITVSNSDWTTLENLGVAFLPYCYYRNQENGFYNQFKYWSGTGNVEAWQQYSSNINCSKAWCVYRNEGNTPDIGNDNRWRGACVRLVYDIQ